MVVTGDSVKLCAEMDADSIDSIVTDPPYHLTSVSRNGSPRQINPDSPYGRHRIGEKGFMGKTWDGGDVAFRPETWSGLLRVAKPGAHLVAFGGTRTEHRLVCAIEDAGWEIRDKLMFLFASGFPKSLSVSKAIDKQRHDRDEIYLVTSWIRTTMHTAGLTAADIDRYMGFNGMAGHWISGKSQPAIPTLGQVPELLAVLGDPFVPENIAELLIELNGAKGQPGENWFKREVIGKHPAPANSIYTMGEKDLPSDVDITAAASEEAAQWEGWGTALKPAWESIVLARKPLEGTVADNVKRWGTGALNIDGCRIGTSKSTPHSPSNHSEILTHGKYGAEDGSASGFNGEIGRWPANVVLDEASAEILDRQTGDLSSGFMATGTMRNSRQGYAGQMPNRTAADTIADSGGASRFFFTSKASRSEREAGLHHRVKQKVSDGRAVPNDTAYQRDETLRGNTHPTVKSLDLMRWLCRMVNPPGGTILDPFCGSGTTGMACVHEGFEFTGIEISPEYADLARERIFSAVELLGNATTDDIPETRTGAVQLGLLL